MRYLGEERASLAGNVVIDWLFMLALLGLGRRWAATDIVQRYPILR
jgi:hypothetical protein